MHSTKLIAGPVYQPRDFDLMCGLLESRFMTSDHVSKLYFGGRIEATRKRLQRLKGVGLIGERPRRVNDPSILFLTRKAYRFLRDQGYLANYPQLGETRFEQRIHGSLLTQAHELQVMDVKTAFSSAIKMLNRFRIVEFSTWPALYEFTVFQSGKHYGLSKEKLVQPDGFIRIQENESDGTVSEHTFFLELDRSTESLTTILGKAVSYVNYYRSGGLAERFGEPRETYASFPFRVLMIFKSIERRNNVAKILLNQNPPILTQVWLSTINEVLAAPFECIWIQPKDLHAFSRKPEFSVSSDNKRFWNQKGNQNELTTHSLFE